MFARRKPAAVAPEIPSSRVQAIIDAPTPAEYKAAGGARLRQARASVRKPATLCLNGGRELPVTIRNLSAGGCRIEFVAPVRPSGRVLLIEKSVPLELWADVIWQGEGVCGLAFEEHDVDLTSFPHTAIANPQTPGPTPQPPRAANLRKSRSPLRKM